MKFGVEELMQNLTPIGAMCCPYGKTTTKSPVVT